MSEMGVQEGQVLGRYELLLRVAQGGMARVWAARLHGTRGFRKLVAVKTILPGAMGEERLEQMLLEEATLASGIHHPNVVDTIELGEHDGTMFMALEWVDGEPLSLVLSEAAKGTGVPLPLGVNIVAQACKGLHAAHELTDQNGTPLGLVHRDISPHNVLVSYSGIVKLVDFGIAKATQRASSLTEAGEIKGKLAYMAPEQVRGREVDRRADLFALGTILYVITTGRHPWKGDNPGATTERLVSERPAKPPSAFVPDYPEALEAVVLKALEKSPDKRFATAAEMLAALDDALPTSLEGNAEARVAEFMQGLLGARGLERRKQIRLAGDLLELRRASSGVVMTTATSSSTSAVAVDMTGSGRFSHAAFSAPPSQPTPTPTVQPRRFARLAWVGAAVTCAAVAGFVGSQALERGPATSPTTAASLPLARDAEAPRAPAAAPPSSAVVAATTPPAPEPEPSATDSADRQTDARTDKRRRLRTDGARPAIASDARRADAGPPASAAPAATADAHAENKTPAASTVAPPASANAWNPNTFGNRY